MMKSFSYLYPFTHQGTIGNNTIVTVQFINCQVDINTIGQFFPDEPSYLLLIPMQIAAMAM